MSEAPVYHAMFLEHAIASFFLVGAGGHRTRYSFAISQHPDGGCCGHLIAQDGRHFDLDAPQTRFARNLLAELGQLVSAVNVTGQARAQG